MSSKSYSGKDLEKALEEGTITQAQATLIGMVKSSEKSGHVSFSQAGCGSWVDLPTDMIEHADQEGQRPCRDHSHPVMRITLKEPKDAQGKILLALLAQTAPSTSEAQQVNGLRTYPTPTPETGVSFSRFGQNVPPQPWLNVLAGGPLPMGGPDTVPTGPFADSGALGGPMGVTHQINMGMPVCRWQVYPCGFTRDPFRIVWCRVYVCRFGGYDGYDIVVK